MNIIFKWKVLACIVQISGFPWQWATGYFGWEMMWAAHIQPQQGPTHAGAPSYLQIAITWEGGAEPWLRHIWGNTWREYVWRQDAFGRTRGEDASEMHGKTTCNGVMCNSRCAYWRRHWCLFTCLFSCFHFAFPNTQISN